jgi:hypothetical protein
MITVLLNNLKMMPPKSGKKLREEGMLSSEAKTLANRKLMYRTGSKI